jgi:hypothetical protein
MLILFKERGGRRNSFDSLITAKQLVYESSISEEAKAKVILDLISPWPSKTPLTRVGTPADGGYVLNFRDLDQTTFLISGGIETNNDFEVALAERGVNGIQIDNSIRKPPKSHSNMDFSRETIGIRPEEFSLKSYIAKLTDERILVKLDIEGSEWEVIDSLSINDLKLITCLAVEFHFLSRLNQTLFFTQAVSVFTKIREAGFLPCFISPNNVTGADIHGGIMLPRNLEITFTKAANINFDAPKMDWITLRDMVEKNRAIHSSVNIDHIIFHNYIK